MDLAVLHVQALLQRQSCSTLKNVLIISLPLSTLLKHPKDQDPPKRAKANNHKPKAEGPRQTKFPTKCTGALTAPSNAQVHVCLARPLHRLLPSQFLMPLSACCIPQHHKDKEKDRKRAGFNWLSRTCVKIARLSKASSNRNLKQQHKRGEVCGLSAMTEQRTT